MFSLVNYDSNFLELSWKWLKDPEIKFLTLTKDFSKDDQKKFFESLPVKKNYWIRGVEYNNIPIGVLGIKHIVQDEGEYWGFIGEKEYWGKGIGLLMLIAAKNKALELSIRSLYLHVGDFNIRAKKLYEKFGFILESVNNNIERYKLTL